MLMEMTCVDIRVTEFSVASKEVRFRKTAKTVFVCTGAKNFNIIVLSYSAERITSSWLDHRCGLGISL